MKSIYRVILPVQKRRDEQSGLLLVNRYFVPDGEVRNHPLLWTAVDWLTLSCLVCGLMLMIVSGFSVPIPNCFFLLLMGMTAAAAVKSAIRLKGSASFAVEIAIILCYLLVLYLNQDSFISGVRQLVNLVIDTLNTVYSGSLAHIFPDTGSGEAWLFLTLAAWPVLRLLGKTIIGSDLLLLTNLIVFPVLAVICLCGGANNTLALFMVLFGIMLAGSFSVQRRQYRMWGGDDKELWEKNRRRFQGVQKKTAVLILLASMLLSLPGFLVVRPLLGLALKPTESYSTQVQSGILNRLIKFLPEITAGRVSLNLETTGGGVQDGSLSSDGGYLLEGVEDLQLTLNTKPTETLFLKGFIGTVYSGGSWKEGYESLFDGAAINWNTEGSPRLYIQNLPFLRTAFAISQSGGVSGIGSTEPSQLLITRLNANENFTYVPYGTFLNSYYVVQGGDGAISGQTEQEDRLLFFFRQDIDNAISAWNNTEDTASVLDRVEESYRAFCENNYTKATAIGSLADEVASVRLKNHWDPHSDTEEISNWIRAYLADGFSYSLVAEVPEGSDPLEYFLFTSKSGNSVHYASAAVMLYRLFGVPARYVVGYEVPASLFSAQAGGYYTATVQGDNSQAWAEIYVPGYGWQPKDMTPGVIGTYEEVGPGGEKIESVIAPARDEAEPDIEETPADEPSERETEAINELLVTIQHIGLERMIRIIAVSACALIITICMVLALRLMSIRLGLAFPGRSRQSRMLALFGTFYKRMKRLGLPDNIDSQSPLFTQYCEWELIRRGSQNAVELKAVVGNIYCARFGPGEFSEEDIKALRRLYFDSFRRVQKQ